MRSKQFDHHFSDASETSDREVDEQESNAQKKNQEIGHVTWARLKKHGELFQTFYVTGLKLKAVFGQELYDCCEEIRKSYGRIRVSAQMLYNTPYEGYEDKEFRKKLENDVWDVDSKDPDSIEQRVNTAVRRAEEILTPHLQ